MNHLETVRQKCQVQCSIGPHSSLETVYCWSTDTDDDITELCKQKIMDRLKKKPFGIETYEIIERKDEPKTE